MALDFHTVSLPGGSDTPTDSARLFAGFNIDVVTPKGNGDPTAIAAGTPGAGYATIPTVAYATAGTGASGTAVANMGVVVLPTITAGGTGGTPGAVTLTGTDGTGTKYQVTGVINGGGVLASLTAITVAGVYTALPGTLSAGAVSGGSLTGTTLNLTGSFGVVSYTVSNGSSNHQYPVGTTAALTGGTPTTAAVPGAVTITSVAGQGCSLVVSRTLPPKFAVFVEPNDDRRHWITGKSSTGFTINFAPGLASATLAAGTADLRLVH